MQPNLEYKYEDYEEDFHNEEANDKNKSPLTVEYQLQTEHHPPPKEKTEEE
jgi:hypothetical protein